MDFKGMAAYRQMDNGDASSSRDSSLAPSEPDRGMQQGGSRKNNKNLDRRRESSRYAARDRRGKEADIFEDLKTVVPLVEESTVTHVDRIALLRVASTMCRMRRNGAKCLETDLPAEDPQVQVFTEQNLTECLDGFVLLADSDGTILYVSESVSLFLGLTQTDLVGRFLKEFVHNDDYDELVRWSTTDTDAAEATTLDDFGRYLVVRMKTVISPRGRTLNLKSALYKAILCRFRAVTTEYGRLSLIYGSSTPAGQGNSLMLANSAVKGAESTSCVYMTRHTCDMRFSYVSDSLNFLLKHDSRSLMSTSFYDLIHPADVQAVARSFSELFKKSHCRTPFYRMLGANSSVVWVQTEATTVNHTARGQKGQYVLCVHSVTGMQSEAESWEEPVVDTSATAANPAICSANIKREIVDVADYMGRQPEFVECIDFQPLIDPVMDMNYTDFNPVRPLNGRGRRSNGQSLMDDMETAPQAKQNKRKVSYDAVLDWLTQEVDNPPPPFTDPNYSVESEDMFTASIESNKAFNQSDRQPVNNRSFRRTSTLTAPTLDGRTVIGRGAPSAIPADGGFVGNMDGRRQRFSRYDQHQQQRQTTGTVVNGQRPTPARTISAIPTNVGYPLSSVNQRVFERTVNFNGATNNTTMHAALPTSRPTLQANRTSRLTDEPQFIGELRRNRSRSNSSTASSSYGQSAARRYSAQNSPAPTRRHGCNEELRVQRPLNVNTLNAVPTSQLNQLPYNQQQQFNSRPIRQSQSPNFYYAARNTSNPIYYQQQPIRSERPMQQQTDMYPIPAKRTAYGCNEPSTDCIQTDNNQCEDLSYLAPYVPSDELNELNSNWEELCNDFNFDEFFPTELPANSPPQMSQPPRQQQMFKSQPMMDQMDIRNQPFEMESQNQRFLLSGADPNLNEAWGFNQY